MRKLGSEHSVAFFAFGEKIASCVNKSNEDTLDSSDVPSSPSEVRDALLEPEARSLEELYSVQDEFYQYMSDGTSELRRGSYRMRRKRRDRSNVLKALNLSTTAWTQPSEPLSRVANIRRRSSTYPSPNVYARCQKLQSFVA